MNVFLPLTGSVVTVKTAEQTVYDVTSRTGFGGEPINKQIMSALPPTHSQSSHFTPVEYTGQDQEAVQCTAVVWDPHSLQLSESFVYNE